MPTLREPDETKLSRAQAVLEDGSGGPGNPYDQDELSSQITGLLHQAEAEAKVLRAERRSLAQRVDALERELRAAETRNEQLGARVAELEHASREQGTKDRASNQERPGGVIDPTVHALRSSQKAANDLVERARQRAREIEHSAVQNADQIRKRAEAEAQRALSAANRDAGVLLRGAQASSEELLGEAREARARAAAQLADRRTALEEEVNRLEARRIELLESFAAIKSDVDEAIHTLESGPATRISRRPGRSSSNAGGASSTRERAS